MEHKGRYCYTASDPDFNFTIMVFSFFGFWLLLMIIEIIIAIADIHVEVSSESVVYCWIVYYLILSITQLRMRKKHKLLAREFIAPDNGDIVADATPCDFGITIILKRGHLIEKMYINYSDFFIKRCTRDDISLPIFYIRNGYVRKVDNPLHFDEDSKDLYEIINESA